MIQRRACGRLLAGMVLAALLVSGDGSGLCLAQSGQAPRVAYLRLPPRSAQIFGSDNRVPVPDTTDFPYSAIGQVLAFYGDVVQIGTGAVIGNRTILTSAHIVQSPEFGRAQSVRFIPGVNGDIEPFGNASAIAMIVPQAYLDTADEDADIAVVVLDRNVGVQTGILQLASPAASDLENATLTSAGYPADLTEDVQHSVTGQFLDIEGNFLLETIDTEPGQSGSPIWYTSPMTGQPQVVAVLKGTRELTDGQGVTTVQGVGIRITPEYADLINNTLSRYGDQPQNIPVAPADMAACGTCGAGTGQALLASSLAWTACFVSRRRRRA